jgi:hypothetical protein
MSDDTPPKREPQQSVEDSLSVSDRVTRRVDAARTVEETVHISESVEVAVGHAQAMIATAIGQAHDASIRIEEFSAAATTDEERNLAAGLRSALDDIGGQLTSIDATLKGMRTDASGGGRSTIRYNRAFLVLGCGAWSSGSSPSSSQSS